MNRSHSMDVLRSGSMDCLTPQRLATGRAVWAPQQQLQELGASGDGDLHEEQQQQLQEPGASDDSDQCQEQPKEQQLLLIPLQLEL